MRLPAREQPGPAAPFISSIPLIAAALSSYGPVGLNYGFALYFLNYRHGFVKRGLVGAIVSPVQFLNRPQLLTLEYAFLAAGFALTCIVFRRILFGSRPERILAAILLSAPAALPHLGYLFAQPDITLYLVVLGCLALFLHTDSKLAAALSLPLCCVGLLAHEAFLLMFYPVVVAVMFYLWHRRQLPFAAVLLHGIAVLACFAAIVHWGALKVSPDLILHEAQARTSVPIQPQVYEVLASTLSQQRVLVHRMYSLGVMRTLWLTLALSAPYFLLLVRLLDRTMRLAALPSLARLTTTALFLSPLLLCTLGHDTTRWIGAMCLDATLFLLVVYLLEPEDSPARHALVEWAESPTAFAWLGYLIAIGPYGATGLRSAEQLITAWFGI